jgi:O-antigen/teichoic acid export membrane protein
VKNIKNMFKSSFAKSVLLVTGGTASAQLLNTILSPLITRLYLPEDYGSLTLYTSILGFLGIISSLKYEHGIAIANSDKKAINIFALSILTLFSFVGVITILLVLIRIIFSDFNIEFMYLIPLGIFTTGIYKILMQWSLRKKLFRSISKTKVTQSIFSNFTKIGFGLIHIGAIGLILGNIVGGSSGIRTLSLSLTRDNKKLFNSIKFKRIVWSARRYVRFPIFLAPSQLLNAAGVHVPVFFLSFMYGNQLIGYYGLANTIVNLPTLLIGNSVGDVFYGEAASIGKKYPEKLLKLSRKLFIRLLLLGLLPLIALVLFGPYLFSIVFGANWYEAGYYARILAFLVFARLIFMPLSRIFEVYEKQKEVLILDSLRIILVLSVFIISSLASLNSYFTVTLYSIVMSFVYFLTFVLAQKTIKDEIRHIKRNS